MRRRDFVTLLGGATAWPLVARAQQGEQMRAHRPFGWCYRGEHDAQSQARIMAFRHALEALGWIEGRNIRIDYRFAGGITTSSWPLLAHRCPGPMRRRVRYW
jgi:putative ABC transport system substrate-binding protein